jgi:hypothetical protein
VVPAVSDCVNAIVDIACTGTSPKSNTDSVPDAVTLRVTLAVPRIGPP